MGNDRRAPATRAITNVLHLAQVARALQERHVILERSHVFRAVADLRPVGRGLGHSRRALSVKGFLRILRREARHAPPHELDGLGFELRVMAAGKFDFFTAKDTPLPAGYSSATVRVAVSSYLSAGILRCNSPDFSFARATPPFSVTSCMDLRSSFQQGTNRFSHTKSRMGLTLSLIHI